MHSGGADEPQGLVGIRDYRSGRRHRPDPVRRPGRARIQTALSRCAGTGRAVVLAPGFGNGNNAFLSGPLTIGNREVLLIDAGVTLYASLNPADYQIPAQYPTNTCGTVSAAGGGCSPFLSFIGSGSGLMGTRGPNGTLGAIDGRGEHTLAGSTQSWWDLAQTADSGGEQNNPILVEGDGVNNLTIYQVELANSPMYHVYIQNGHGLTVWGVEINTPATARNTDGVDPVSESDVTIKDDMIQNGDELRRGQIERGHAVGQHHRRRRALLRLARALGRQPRRPGQRHPGRQPGQRGPDARREHDRVRERLHL
jgi:polygalacturonase